MECLILADNHSLKITVAIITSNITLTCVQAKLEIEELKYNPIPPAPTKPNIVDSLIFISHLKTDIPAKAGKTWGTIP